MSSILAGCLSNWPRNVYVRTYCTFTEESYLDMMIKKAKIHSRYNFGKYKSYFRTHMAMDYDRGKKLQESQYYER